MTISGTTASIASGATATATLAAIEAATGVNVPFFVWGMIGGFWAFWHLDSMSAVQRLSSLAIAALVAGVTAKPAAMIVIAGALHFLPWWPAAVDAELAGRLVALVIGLLCHTVIGRKLIELASRGADEVLK